MQQLPSELPLMTNQEDPIQDIYNSIQSKSPLTNRDKALGTINFQNKVNSLVSANSKSEKLSFQNEGFQVQDAYTKLSDGTFITRYDDFLQNTDNEDRHAQQQSTASKWTNGLGKFVGKTANNIVGGTLGTVYGAISAIAEGNWERIYDNEFYDFLDDQNAKMDNFAANYRSQEERNMGFGSSMLTANFWADDFLGGMSFMTGTVISEALWALGTGGVSLTTTAARVGLRATKYFHTAKTLVKGVKEAQKVARQYGRLSAIKNATSLATKYGKAGEILNLTRFTYTSAGFEAGMEARLYQKEQRENFNRDFQHLNGRKPGASEIAEFENNLDKTTNTLWATNMALVGTSNFAILGKTFGITSPFKLPSKNLNKVIFGNGVKTTFGKAGERISTEAIKRTKLQRSLGFGKSILKNPFYEGIIEEGGQATASTAMESYLTSRYNPSKDAMGLTESMYEGLSHTYGTKEGWKEVGLGMLIGLVGGESSNVLSGQGLFKEAREAFKEEDAESVKKATMQNEHTGVKTVNKIFASRVEQNLRQATEVQHAQEEYEKAENKGDIMGMATAQGKVMLSSIASAVSMDYLKEQTSDFETALKMKDPVDLAEHYGIEENEVETKIGELVSEYKQLGEDYKSAKDFANYIISDNPKELFEDATDINVEVARDAVAYQMAMTNIIEQSMEGAYDALISSVSELNPQLATKYMKALNRFNQINRSKKEDVQALAKVENRIGKKRKDLNTLVKRQLKVDQKTSSTPEGNQKIANERNSITNKIQEIEEQISSLTIELGDKNSRLDTKKAEMSNLNISTRALANQLDTIDPLAGEELVSETTIEETQKSLEELDSTLNKIAKTNPQLVEKILKLGSEYRSGLEMWKRNADTIADLSDPKIGLKRIGTLLQRKQKAGTTTLEFLKRLQKTHLEEEAFLGTLDKLVKTEETESEVNEQEEAEKNVGEDITQEENEKITVDSPVQKKIKELKKTLKTLVGKNNFILENFTNNAEVLEQDKAPTQEEIQEYEDLRNKFKSGDINKLVGRPIEQISKRIKERSGLTDVEIIKYQELSQKMLDWRVVTGTNANGVSIQDILNQIEAYEKDLQNSGAQVSAEQVLEMAEQGQSEFSVDVSDPDYVNSMDKVNIKQDKIQTTISHLKMSTIENSKFNVTYLREENRGTESAPDLAAVYQLEKDGKVFEIQYTNDHHRVVISKNNTQSFLDGMEMQTVKYNTKTGWGYVFKEGVPMQSDFGIELIDNPEVNIMNPQLVYELQPGDKVSFAVNMKDKYNSETIIPLIKAGDIQSATRLMSVYIVSQKGEVLGFLKSGVNAQGSNFNKVREEAVKALQTKLNSSEVTLEDLANDNTNSVLNLPFEIEVEKTFVGTPNIELDSNRNVKVFKITEEQSELIVGFGYAENGNLKEDKEVRKTFIPKNKNSSYVVIQHGNTKVAFPVGITATNSTLKNQVLEILNSEIREPQKITNIISLLKQNGIEPADFNLDGLKDNSSELNRLLKSLEGGVRTYTKKELQKMTKEEFIAAAEIVINLDKPAFVSPKLKTSLSKKLIDTKTGENTKSNELTETEKQDMLIQHLVHLSKAKKKEEVLKFVMETGDELFIKEFIENAKFKKEVVKASLKNKRVPSIQTNFSMENILQDVIDISSKDVPLDIQEKFEKEIEELKNNPTKSKIASLSKKIIKAIENRYKLVNSSVDTNNLYHIATTENEAQMFEQGYVKVIGDFYKKIDKRYDVRQLLEGLYNKYKNKTLPSNIQLSDQLSLEDFIEKMPNTLLDIYKLYYNTQIVKPTKKSAIVGNEQYLREDFKGDFAEFIQKEKKKGSVLYKKVLQHFQITDKGILKEKLLTRDKINSFEQELGDNYSLLLNYSLINKHIDLQEQPQSVIFVEDIENTNRLEAINNPNLIEPKAKVSIKNDGKTISFSKVNKPFIQHEGGVYEQVYSNKQGNYAYERIATIDPNFIITEVIAPFNTTTVEINKEIDRTGTNINITEGREIDC